MHIKTSCGSYWRAQWTGGCNFDLDIELLGSGISDDPYIITVTSPFDSANTTLEMSYCEKYLKIQGIEFRALYLNYCKNITISNIKVKYLGLGNCSTIAIQDAQIRKEMRISESSNIEVSESQIKNLIASSGDQIFFLNCKINKISRNSKANYHLISEEALLDIKDL